jgi:hypothetical protein
MIKKYGLLLAALFIALAAILFYTSGKFNPLLEEKEQSCPAGATQPSGHSAQMDLSVPHYQKKTSIFQQLKV